MDVIEVDLVEVGAPLRVGLLSKISSALSRKSRIHCGSSLYSEICSTISLVRALRGLVGVAGFGIAEAELLGVVSVDPWTFSFSASTSAVATFKPPA